MRPLPALEALPHTPQRRLMLLGAPGSGKSTFVSHLASCLGRATLDGLRDDTAPADSPWMTRLPTWSLGPLLPIRIVLRDYAAFASSAPAEQRGGALLHAFLELSYDAHLLPLRVGEGGAHRALLKANLRAYAGTRDCPLDSTGWMLYPVTVLYGTVRLLLLI